MSLKHTLALLVELEAAGKLTASAQHVSTLYDPNHEIVLTMRAEGPDVREQFLAAGPPEYFGSRVETCAQP